MAVLTDKEINDFLTGYEKLCRQHQLYFVFEDVFLQVSGETLDIDEAISVVSDSIAINNR